jgi:hypothetical protein
MWLAILRQTLRRNDVASLESRIFCVIDALHFECFYIRPKNGRSEDQLQRKHSTQYISIPGFPWDKLRSETPGKYESYVDPLPGLWTKIKIQVVGQTASLFVNGAASGERRNRAVGGAGNHRPFCWNEDWSLKPARVFLAMCRQRDRRTLLAAL